MAKKVIKLTEAQLKSVVEKVIMEQGAPAPAPTQGTAPQAQAPTEPKLAPDQEPIITKDGRKQPARWNIPSHDLNILKESLRYFVKQIPVYQSKLLPSGIVRLKGLGLKTANTDGFFKHTGDAGTLTHTFTFRTYYPEMVNQSKPGVVKYFERTYYLGCKNPNATADEILKSLNNELSSPIVTQFKEKDSEQINIDFINDFYIKLRNILGLKNTMVQISTAMGLDEYITAMWVSNNLLKLGKPEDKYMDDNLKNTPDESGQTPIQKYQPYYKEIRELYFPYMDKKELS